jgi:hypothetical protein
MIIRFTPAADAELAEARQWYARQREDLDFEFMECIDVRRYRAVMCLTPNSRLTSLTRP